MRFVFAYLLLISQVLAQTNSVPKTSVFQIGVDDEDDRVTSARPLPVLTTPSPYAQRGKIDGITLVHKFGYVGAVDAADGPTDVWAWGSDTASGALLKTWPTVAATLYIASSSSSDTDLDVKVYYIDASGYEKNVTVNTNGQNSVSLGVTALDINRAYISNGNAAVGNLYICNTNAFTSGVPNTAADVLAYIPIGYAQTQQACFRVPIDYRLILTRIQVLIARASGAAGSAEVELLVKEPGGTWRVLRPWYISTSVLLNIEEQGLDFPGGSFVRLNLEDVSDGDTNCTGCWHGVLVKE